MPSLKKIMIVISSLEGGGAERAVCTMANYWVDQQKDVTIVTFSDQSARPAYTLFKAVRLYPLNVLGKRVNAIIDNFLRMYKIRNAIKDIKPDGIYTFIEPVNNLTVLAAIGLKIPVVISDRTNSKLHRYGYLWHLLRFFTYPLSKALVVQTQEAFKDYPEILKQKATIIPNFLAVPVNKNHNNTESKIITAMGRLGYEKGFDILICAFAKIASDYPEWSLEIWGQGSEQDKLQDLIKTLGLESRVRMPGFSKDVTEVMQNTAIFVLSSRYEGFPNVLIEAMACGAPVIATRCPSGPEGNYRTGHKWRSRTCRRPLLTFARNSKFDRTPRFSEKLRQKSARRRAKNICRNILSHVGKLWHVRNSRFINIT